MKLAIIALTLIPAMSWAKVSDFNALIDENSKVQRELQQNIEEKTLPAQEALPTGPAKMVVVRGETYNVPTADNALKFEKEKHHNERSNKKEMDRLAEEFKSIDREY